MTMRVDKPVRKPIAVGEQVEFIAHRYPTRRYTATVIKVHEIYDTAGWPLVDLRFGMTGADGQRDEVLVTMAAHLDGAIDEHVGGVLKGYVKKEAHERDRHGSQKTRPAAAADQ